MSEKIDTNSLLSQVNIVDVIGKFVSLTKRNSEYYGVCPFHDDHKESLQVNERKQIYKCFACDDPGGDAIQFLIGKGYKFHDAVKYLGGEEIKPSEESKKRIAKAAAAPVWKQIKPTSPPVEIKHYQHGKPAAVWTYRDAQGKIIGFVCRFNFPDGRKDVIPFVFATDGKKNEWRWLGFASPRPLYNLDKIIASPDKMVMVVEGEKTADAAQKLFPSVVVTCWIGGAKAIAETDWAPLFGRKILLWPDNDKMQAYGEKHEKAGQVRPWEEQPGNAAMIHIEGILTAKCPVIRWVKNEDSLPDKWDVADAKDWTPEAAALYAKKNIYKRGANPVMTPEKPAPKVEVPTAPPASTPEPPKAPTPPKPKAKQVDLGLPDQPFKFLGFDKTESGGQRFHFFVSQSRSVISLAATSLGTTSLMTLAPLNWWESNFPAKNGVDKDAAAQFIIAYGSRRAFTGKNIRGRGAWMEGRDVVLHAGDYLVVNGKEKAISQHESKYIYELAEELGFNTDHPLTTNEAVRLMEVFKLINWERPINPYLIAGWAILAPVCGALKWRPHIWVTGGAGVGKTWLFREIIKMLLGESALRVQSETTEAGIRQTLHHDALPVVFDEAEGGERKDSERIQNILNLVRGSSADDAGVMAKGSAGGTAQTFQIRSCFAFASIAVGVFHQSDRSRVSVLGMIAEEDKVKGAEKWKKLQALQLEVITEEYCARLRARTINLLPVIVENARTFAAAVAAELGEQRAGDQLGTLLAGAYSLVSDKVITYADACEWVASKDWSEEKQNGEQYRDENRLLQLLMETTVTLDSAGSKWDRTIGELIEIAAGLKVAPQGTVELIEPDRAADRLRRFGIKADSQHVYFSNTSDQIRNRLRETMWSKNHGKILGRLKTAVHTEPIRFGPAVKARAVRIDIVELLGNGPAPAHSPAPNGGGSHDSDETPF
jgi:putative DNA primase/helicase